MIVSNLTQHKYQKTDTICVDFRHKRGHPRLDDPLLNQFVPEHLPARGQYMASDTRGFWVPPPYDVAPPAAETDVFAKGGCPFPGAPPDFLAIAPAAVPCPRPRSLNDRPTTERERRDRTRDGIDHRPPAPCPPRERETLSRALRGSPPTLHPNG